MKFPKMVINQFATTTFDMVANLEGLTKDGEPNKIELNGLNGNYQAKAQAEFDKDGKHVTTNGCIYVDGDILPNQEIDGGTVTINGNLCFVHSVQKSLNPDGTVNHCIIKLK